MAEYIDREEAVSAAREGADAWDGGCNASRDMYLAKYIGSIPAADVAPVRHGTWEEVEVTDYPESNLMVASMFCPKCKRYHNEVYHYGNPTEMARYCGFCGAKMDAEEV